MALASIVCPHCGSEDVVKNGHYANGKQRYMCKNPDCCCKAFMESYSNKAYDPKVKEKIFELTVNDVGTRATARILGISKNTVTDTLKKTKAKSPK